MTEVSSLWSDINDGASPSASPCRSDLPAGSRFPGASEDIFDLDEDPLHRGGSDDDHDDEDQDFSDVSVTYTVRYPRARDGHWLRLVCSDAALQMFHPHIKAGMKVHLYPNGSSAPVQSTIIGVCDGFLWRHDDGAAGVTSLAARHCDDLAAYYRFECRIDQKRARLRDVAKEPLALADEMLFFSRSATQRNNVVQKPSTSIGGVQKCSEGSAAAGATSAAWWKARRLWVPTRTGNNYFEYSPEEDADLSVSSFHCKPRAIDSVKSVFGHQKVPFLYFAPIPARDSQRGGGNPLFPMVCEYDVSPSSMQSSRMLPGQAVLLRSGPRAGRVMFVLGTLYGRLVLHEDGGFPMECDTHHNAFSSMDPFPLDGFVSALRPLTYATPGEHVPLSDETTPSTAIGTRMKACVPSESGDAAAAELSLPPPCSVVCCGVRFFVSAPLLFYRFGLMHMCRVLHHKGERKGTTGLILGVQSEDDLRSALWEYNETDGCCAPLTGASKYEIELNHGLELIGYRLAFAANEDVARASGLACESELQPWLDSTTQRYTTDSTEMSIGLLASSSRQHPSKDRRTTRDSRLAAEHKTYLLPCQLEQSGLLEMSLTKSLRAPQAVTPTSSERVERQARSSATPSAVHRATLPSPGKTVWSPGPAGGESSGDAKRVVRVLPLDTNWSALLRFSLGVHGSVVQFVSGVRYGRRGVIAGCYGDALYAVFDHEKGAEVVGIRNSRGDVQVVSGLIPLKSINPKPFLFAPPPKPTMHMLVMTNAGLSVDVDTSWQATWRFGHLSNQRIIVGDRSHTGYQVHVSAESALKMTAAERESFGWRTGTVVGVYHGELFLVMDDTKVAEPLSGANESELLRQYVIRVFQHTEVQATQDHFLEDMAMACGAHSSVLPLPEIPTSRLFKITQEQMPEDSEKKRGYSLSAQNALVDCCLDVCVAALKLRCIGFAGANNGGWVEALEQERQRCRVCAAMGSSGEEGSDSLTATDDKALCDTSLRVPIRLRRKVRIEPVRRTTAKGLKEWAAYGADHWCTVVGVCDDQLFACFDSDPRCLRPLPLGYEAELLTHCSPGYVPLAAKLLPMVQSPAFQCTKSMEASLVQFQEHQKALQNLSSSSAGSHSPSRGLRGASAAAAFSAKRDVRKLVAAMAGMSTPDDTAEIVPYVARVQCDNAGIRAAALQIIASSPSAVREARLQCETLPKKELLQIVDWVLSCHGVRLHDGETIQLALALLAAVIATTTATLQANVNPEALPLLDENLGFVMPSTQQWCLHQRVLLVDREVGDRTYTSGLEKQERERLAFTFRTRLERLRSVFDEPDEPAEEDALCIPPDDALGATVPGNTMERAASFGSSVAGSRRISRKSTNLSKIFGNKWRRSVDTSVLSSVTSAAFLPQSMRERIFSNRTSSETHLISAAVARAAAGSSPSPLAEGSGSAAARPQKESRVMELLEAGRHDRCSSASDDSDGVDSLVEAKSPRLSPSSRGAGEGRSHASDAAVVSRLEQLQSTNVAWPMTYTTHTGQQLLFDVSVQACDSFGMYHGQQYQVTAGDTATEIVTIIGVCKRQLWRYSDNSEALPFDGSHATSIIALHRLVFLGVVPHSAVRRADPFCYRCWRGLPLRLDVSEKATHPYGVRFGERYAVLAKRTAAIFEADGYALGAGAPAPSSSATASPRQPQPSGAAAAAVPSGAQDALLVVVVVLGVCSQRKLWVAPVRGVGGARPFHIIGGRSIVEDWRLVFVYSGPVDVNHALRFAPTTTHADPQTSVVDAKSMAAASCAAEPFTIFSMMLPAVRRQKYFRFRAKNGEVLTFDISDETCRGVFGVSHGDRMIFRKPVKLVGKVCVIVGVRDKRLWKVDERDTCASILGTNCRSAKDIATEFGLKVTGHQALREFVG